MLGAALDTELVDILYPWGRGLGFAKSCPSCGWPLGWMPKSAVTIACPKLLTGRRWLVLRG